MPTALKNRFSFAELQNTERFFLHTYYHVQDKKDVKQPDNSAGKCKFA